MIRKMTSSESVAEGTQQQATTVPRHLRWGCVALVLVASIHAASAQVGGNDTWIAFACGRYFLEPFAVSQPGRTWQMHLLDVFGLHLTTQDPFSPFSQPGQWVNQNWLSHVVFYALQVSWGVESIVALEVCPNGADRTCSRMRRAGSSEHTHSLPRTSPASPCWPAGRLSICAKRDNDSFRSNPDVPAGLLETE